MHTVEITVTPQLHVGTYSFECTGDSSAIAYGSYDEYGEGTLEYAPTSEEMEAIDAYINEMIAQSVFVAVLRAARHYGVYAAVKRNGVWRRPNTKGKK